MPAQKGEHGYIVGDFTDGVRQTEWPNLLLSVKKAKGPEPPPKCESSDAGSEVSDASGDETKEKKKKQKNKKKKTAMKTIMKTTLKRPAGKPLQASLPHLCSGSNHSSFEISCVLRTQPLIIRLESS